jgi:hypothetical protein
MADNPAPQHTPIHGDSEYEAALNTILEMARKSVRIFENSLGRGYNSPRRFDLLRAFLLANPRHRLQIVAHDVQGVDRNCPRLLNLMRLHAHAISIHETNQAAKAVYDSFAIVDDLHYVHRFHFEEMRGLLALHDPIGTHTFIERFGEIWESSSPAVSATTLGL